MNGKNNEANQDAIACKESYLRDQAEINQDLVFNFCFLLI